MDRLLRISALFLCFLSITIKPVNTYHSVSIPGSIWNAATMKTGLSLLHTKNLLKAGLVVSSATIFYKTLQHRSTIMTQLHNALNGIKQWWNTSINQSAPKVNPFINQKKDANRKPPHPSTSQASELSSAQDNQNHTTQSSHFSHSLQTFSLFFGHTHNNCSISKTYLSNNDLTLFARLPQKINPTQLPSIETINQKHGMNVLLEEAIKPDTEINVCEYFNGILSCTPDETWVNIDCNSVHSINNPIDRTKYIVLIQILTQCYTDIGYDTNDNTLTHKRERLIAIIDCLKKQLDETTHIPASTDSQHPATPQRLESENNDNGQQPLIAALPNTPTTHHPVESNSNILELDAFTPFTVAHGSLIAYNQTIEKSNYFITGCFPKVIDLNLYNINIKEIIKKLNMTLNINEDTLKKTVLTFHQNWDIWDITYFQKNNTVFIQLNNIINNRYLTKEHLKYLLAALIISYQKLETTDDHSPEILLKLKTFINYIVDQLERTYINNEDAFTNRLSDEEQQYIASTCSDETILNDAEKKALWFKAAFHGQDHLIAQMAQNNESLMECVDEEGYTALMRSAQYASLNQFCKITELLRETRHITRNRTVIIDKNAPQKRHRETTIKSTVLDELVTHKRIDIIEAACCCSKYRDFLIKINWGNGYDLNDTISDSDRQMISRTISKTNAIIKTLHSEEEKQPYRLIIKWLEHLQQLPLYQ